MSIRRIVIPVLSALVVGLALPAFAQEADNALSAVVTPTTGKFVFTFTISVSSTVPKNGFVVCKATANVNESSGQSITQQGNGIVIPSGGKATCTVTMPYSWMLASASSDKVYLSYQVELDEGYEITASNGTGNVVATASVNKVNENLPTINVPLNGSTTNEAVSATI